jgi:hypothetical protein
LQRKSWEETFVFSPPNLNHSMRQLLPCVALAFALALPAAHAQTPAWTGGAQTTNPAPTNDTGAEGRYIGTDAAGNIYVSGYVLSGAGSGVPGSRAFGSTTITSTGLGSGFIAKLSPTLQWQWAVRLSTNGLEGISIGDLAVSPDGDVYVSGATEEEGATTISIGSLNQATTTGKNFFIARLNTSGQAQTLTLIPNTNPSSLSGVDAEIEWDAVSNSLVVLGYYLGVTPVLGSTTLPAAPASGAGFVARLSPAGQWGSVVTVTPTGTSSSSDFGMGALTVGPQGQVGMGVAMSNGTVSLGTSSLVSPNAADENYKVGIAQLSPAGQWQWLAQPAGVAEDFFFTEIKYDRAGNAWLLGSGETGLQLGTFTQPANTDAFVARLSPTGQWGTVGIVQRPAGNSANSSINELAVDASGNAIVTGEMEPGASLNFGSQMLSAASTGTGRSFVARFGAASGQWQYAQLPPATNNGNTYYFNDIALDATGNLLTTGGLRNNISVAFGSTTLTGSAGGDVYVARLGNAGALAARQPEGAPRLALYPNPVAIGHTATLRLPTPAQTTLAVVLRDALGRAVRTTTLPAGRQETTLVTTGLAPGLYQVQAGLSRAQVVVE